MRWLLLLIGLASAGPATSDLPLGRDLRVSVADDHVFVQVRAQGEPRSLGLSTWADFDRDRDGSLDAGERVPLLEALRREECRYAALSVGEQPVPLARFEVIGLNLPERLALDAPLGFRVQGRLALSLPPDGLPFVFYDRPSAWQGAVPIRLSVAEGLRVVGVQGEGRRELRSPQRLDAVLTNGTPAVWGRIERE